VTELRGRSGAKIEEPNPHPSDSSKEDWSSNDEDAVEVASELLDTLGELLEEAEEATTPQEEEAAKEAAGAVAGEIEETLTSNPGPPPIPVVSTQPLPVTPPAPPAAGPLKAPLLRRLMLGG
jgi:hypothetical protein